MDVSDVESVHASGSESPFGGTETIPHVNYRTFFHTTIETVQCQMEVCDLIAEVNVDEAIHSDQERHEWFAVRLARMAGVDVTDAWSDSSSLFVTGKMKDFTECMVKEHVDAQKDKQ